LKTHIKLVGCGQRTAKSVPSNLKIHRPKPAIQLDAIRRDVMLNMRTWPETTNRTG
jgi:hypothetical protein